jgi:coatomer subunit alpha
MFRYLNKTTSLSYSQKDNAVVVTTETDGGSWELYTIPKRSNDEIDYCTQTKKGKGLSATFIGINKFAVLVKEKTIELFNSKTGESKQVNIEASGVKQIFRAQAGRVLLRSDEKVYLYDFEQVK